MASIGLLIRRALANTLASTASSYWFSRLSKDSIDKETRLSNRAASRGTGRMGALSRRMNRLYQQATQFGKESWVQTHGIELCHERVS